MAFTKGTKVATAMHPQIVLMLIDNSGSMAEDKKCEQVTAAVQDMVITMQSLNQGSSGFRFVMNISAFGDSVKVLAVAASPSEIDVDSLVFLGDDGATNMHLALQWAKIALQRSLDRCRTGIPNYQEDKAPNPLCVVLSDGEITGENCKNYAQAIHVIPFKNGNVDVVAVGVGMLDQHFESMKEVASRPDYAVQIGSAEVADFLSEVGSSIVLSNPVGDLVKKPR